MTHIIYVINALYHILKIFNDIIKSSPESGHKVCMEVKVKSLCHVWLFVTPWTVSSIHGIFQARVLEWVAISLSRGSSWPRDWTWVSFIANRCFYRLSHQGSQGPWMAGAPWIAQASKDCAFVDSVQTLPVAAITNQQYNNSHNTLNIWCIFQWLCQNRQPFIFRQSQHKLQWSIKVKIPCGQCLMPPAICLSQQLKNNYTN